MVIPAPYTLATPPSITHEPFVVESFGRRHCARHSSSFIVPGRVALRPAITPNPLEGARARSSLLAALIIVIIDHIQVLPDILLRIQPLFHLTTLNNGHFNILYLYMKQQ